MLFRSMDRARLHNKGYQQKTVLVIDRMILDALLLADKYFTITTSDGNTFRLSEACDNIESFLQLTDDYILRSIQFSKITQLAKAQSVLKNIIKRSLYKIVGTIEAPGAFPVALNVAKEELNDIRQCEENITHKGMTKISKLSKEVKTELNEIKKLKTDVNGLKKDVIGIRKSEEDDIKYNERVSRWQQLTNENYNKAEIIIAKQRHGPIGSIKMHFDANYTKFSDLTTKDYDNIVE